MKTNSQIADIICSCTERSFKLHQKATWPKYFAKNANTRFFYIVIATYTA